MMNILPNLALLIASAVAAVYAIKAEWIRDYTLDQTEQAFGIRSLYFRCSKWFMDNIFYIICTRLVSGIMAIFLLYLSLLCFVTDYRQV
jgi:hypothetical protein